MYNYLQKDKNFTYKGKSYPIDFALLTRRSLFFYEKQNEFHNLANIEIHDNGIDITEDAIQYFISFCQFEQNEISITSSNVFSIRQLAIEYNVPGLIKLTNDYITDNNKDLVIQSLHHNHQNNQPDEVDEDYISAHFFDYINDSRLIKLPIPVLYRILNNIQKINEMDHDHQNQTFEFMFKCLDEHKKPASVLFQNCNFIDAHSEILNRLLNEYKNIFDFNMINAETIIKKIPEMLNEINKIKLEHSDFLNNVQNKLDLFQTKIDNLTNLIQVQNEEITNLKNTINLQKTEIDHLKELNASQISNFQNAIRGETTILKQDFSNEKQTIERELNMLKEKIKNTENIVVQHKNEQKSFVTKDQLRKIFQAGREKMRNIGFWVNDRTYNEEKWSNGPAFVGDDIGNWINDGRNLWWRPGDSWDAATNSIPQ